MMSAVIRTWASGLFAIVVCACGGTPPAPADPTVAAQLAAEPRRPTPPPSIEPFAGNYSLEGEPVEDGCAGEIVLLAHGLEIDARQRTLRADVVDRDYEAHVEGDQLVATGRLDVREGQCPDATVYERWELRRVEGGGLDGSLYSTWLMWPSCMHVCTVRFSVRARPASGAVDFNAPDINVP